MNRYPELRIDLKKLENNINQMKTRCDELNISLACCAPPGAIRAWA